MRTRVHVTDVIALGCAGPGHLEVEALGANRVGVRIAVGSVEWRRLTVLSLSLTREEARRMVDALSGNEPQPNEEA